MHRSILATLRVAIVISVLVLAAASAASAASAVKLPAGWSHAEVNVVIKHQAHTLIYDRGLITRIAPASLTLKESDGSVVLIAVSPAATVTFAGRRVALDALRRGEFAETVRVDGTPATSVRARKVAPAG